MPPPRLARASDSAVVTATQHRMFRRRPHCSSLREHFGGITMRIGLLARTRTKLVGTRRRGRGMCAALPVASHGAVAQRSRTTQRSAQCERADRCRRCTWRPAHSRWAANRLRTSTPTAIRSSCRPATANNAAAAATTAAATAAAMVDATAAPVAMAAEADSIAAMPMGAGGTDPPIGYDLMNDVGMEGDLVDQRGPHYFDIRAEAVYLHRDKTFEQDIDFTSLNVGNTVVLTYEPVGFRRPDRVSASLAVTTFARCRSSNLATPAFSAGKIVPRSRTRRTTCFRCFRGRHRTPACSAPIRPA